MGDIIQDLSGTPYVRKHMFIGLHGGAGTGKTTIGFSAGLNRRVLIIDPEQGTDYGYERGFTKDEGYNLQVVRMNRWFQREEWAKIFAHIKENVDVLVIDSAGKIMEMLIADDSPVQGKKYRTNDGDPTRAGWGEIKKRFRNFIAKTKRLEGVDVIWNFHSKEIDDDGDRLRRLEIATGLSDEIPTMFDIFGYIGKRRKDDGAVEHFFMCPGGTEKWLTKDRTGKVPDLVPLREKHAFEDLRAGIGLEG